MSTTATITITARDQASQAFQAIGKSAGGMSSSVQQSAKGFDVLKGAMAGLASSAVIGFLGDSARAAAEAEVSMQRLETAVGNTGRAFDDMAPAINDALDGAEQLAFDGEDAADALATLTSTTGDANQALDLLGLTMDIARGRGVDLATAAAAVGKAANGNVGALTRMGVAVQEGATASEALAEAQATFAGQAEAYAGTAAGAADRITVAWGNLKEEIGGLAGPLTGIISLLPGMSAGFSAVGSAIGALKGAGGFAGLLASINPVGLAIGGLALTVGALTLAILDSKQASEDYAAALNGVKTALADVDAEGLRTALDGLALTMDEISGKEIGDTGDGWDKATKALGYYNTALANVVDATQNADGSLIDLSFTVTKLQDDWNTGDATLADVISTMENYTKILNYTGDGHDIAAQSLANLTSEYTYGNLSLDEYSQAVSDILANMGEFDAQARANAEATRTTASRTDELTSSIVGNRREYERLILAKMAAYDATQEEISAEERAANIRGEVATGIVGTASEFERYITSTNNATAATEADREASLRLQETFRSTLTPAIQGASAGFQDLAVDGEDIIDVLSRLGDTVPNIDNHFADLVDRVKDSGAALDGVLGTFNAIDDLGDRSQTAADIAQQVVGDPGVYATVDDLLSRGLITREQYNQMQRDEVRIVNQNARVQEDLNLMRANQIGALEDASSAYSRYIARLSNASAEEQTHALYLMDTANQTKVATAYSTAYEASLGNIPKDVATEIIANGAMADPVLAGILEDYGLIEMGADGTVTVNFPDASEEALNKFQDAFGEGNVTMTADGLIVVTNDDGNQLVYDQFGNLVDKTVKANIEVTLSHSSGLDSDTIGGILAGRGMSAADAGVNETAVAVKVGADTTEFDTALEEAKTSAIEFSNTTYTSDIAGDTMTWDAAVADATSAGTTWDETTFTSGIAGDRDPWDEVLYAASGTGADWEGTTFTASLDGNRSFFDAVVAEVKDKVVGTAYVEINAIDANGDVPGYQLGGTIRSKDISSVSRVYQTAANGRTVLVGEAGPELAFLPSGTQVMPSTASRSRMAADPGSGGGMRFYGPVHIHAASPDIGREIERQFATRAAR